MKTSSSNNGKQERATTMARMRQECSDPIQKSMSFSLVLDLHHVSWISPLNRPKTPVRTKTPSLDAEDALCTDFADR